MFLVLASPFFLTDSALPIAILADSGSLFTFPITMNYRRLGAGVESRRFIPANSV